jgi:TetR/AcrR family transcriptional repressor of nem operon
MDQAVFASSTLNESKRTARGDSMRMVTILLGALNLARAVDDEEFSDEILTEGRRGIT